MRCLAAVVATLCLVGQFSSLAHNLLVRHSTCAEHGEIVHAGDDGSSPIQAIHASGGRTVVSSARARLTETEAAGDSHGHDHCLAVAHGRGHVGLQASAGAIIAAPPALPAISPVGEDANAVFRLLYRLAPKNSPPA